VTCSGAFQPGVPVFVTLNLTATVQGCGDVTGVRRQAATPDESCCRAAGINTFVRARNQNGNPHLKGIEQISAMCDACGNCGR
jgi:hypothetical protein